MQDQDLLNALSRELSCLEREQELVICSTDVRLIAQRLHDAVLKVVPQTGLTAGELHALRSLVLEAVRDERFFDWEMPTLTGLSAAAFEQIANKLPSE